jgi:hypothetical protein
MAEDRHEWVPMFDNGGGGAPDNDCAEDDDNMLGDEGHC